MKRKKIVILVPFPIYLPNNAGANRIFSLSNELSKHYDVVNYSQCVNKRMVWEKLSGKPSFARVIVNNHYKIIQSYNPLYNFLLFLTSRIKAQNFLASTALNLYRDKNLTNELADASLLQVEHPWQYEWAKNITDKYHIPLVLSSHNIESDILKQTVPNIPIKKFLINHLKLIEKKVYQSANNIIYISDNEKVHFKEINENKNICVLPMWADDRLFAMKRIKRQNKNILTILFVGSLWEPNIKALIFIEKIAKENIYNKKLRFVVAGSVGENRKSTKNLIYTGRVNSTLPYYRIADIFINPVTIGGGINYKMIEAMTAALPIITTPFGARGIELINNNSALICDLSLFEENTKKLVDNAKLRERLGKNARKLAIEKYSKKNIIKNVLNFYQKIFFKV